MNLTITAYSTGLFSTWIFIEELGILLDAGDGVSSGLLQKTRKIKQAFITHPDRDHIMGLFQLNPLSAREGYPKIYYPKDCGSFPYMRDFQRKFDVQNNFVEWNPIENLSEIPVRKDFYVKAIRNEHIKAAPEISKSLSYKLYETKEKLKKEYVDLDKKTLQNLFQKKGKENLVKTIETNILSYSGDTPVDDYEKWNGSKILIHEATFLENFDDIKINKENKHSKLDEVLKMVSEIEIEQLILCHFSSRYYKEDIDKNILELCKKYQIKIPIRVIYPGEIHRDILNQKPVNY
ncbi:MBL fold metallo-hydrolase [Aureivirga marina]|uniref:MBL fold metallo-hydrolase n=1 Tax=Aureivirga marina TaxID=1182451 RepID=UPI0018CBAC3F|nr:MBL fold metallo-hydrolase [Aureivirga marina]